MTMLDYFNKAKDTFIGDLVSNRKSDKTVDKYGLVLTEFEQWLAEQPEQSGTEITPLMIVEWKQNDRNRANKSNTLRHYMVILRVFFAWCVEKGIYKANPIAKKDLPKAEEVKLQLLTEQEIDTLLLGKFPLYSHADTALRNRAIVILLLESGLRASELLNLHLGDLDFEKGNLYVANGKGAKSRTTTFPKRSREYVQAYLDDLSRRVILSKTDFVFGTIQNGEWVQFSRQYLTQAVRNYVKNSIGRTDIGAHDLRHAYASTLLTKGAKLEQIQAVLGHKNYSTTVIYAQHLAPESIPASLNSIFEKAI